MSSDTGIIVFTGLPDIIVEGLLSLLHEHLPQYRTYRFKSFQDYKPFSLSNKIDLVITNDKIFESNKRFYHSLKKESPETTWILFQYQYVNSSITIQFDEIITIDQDLTDVLSVIRKSIRKSGYYTEELHSESLSDREKDVLKLLVSGFSGKEVADKLNISVNTVMSHRKNISQKTGIKSLAGLTIYAVTNKIISMSKL